MRRRSRRSWAVEGGAGVDFLEANYHVVDGVHARGAAGIPYTLVAVVKIAVLCVGAGNVVVLRVVVALEINITVKVERRNALGRRFKK